MSSRKLQKDPTNKRANAASSQFQRLVSVLPAPLRPLQDVVPGVLCSLLMPPAPVSLVSLVFPLQLVCSAGGCFSQPGRARFAVAIRPARPKLPRIFLSWFMSITLPLSMTCSKSVRFPRDDARGVPSAPKRLLSDSYYPKTQSKRQWGDSCIFRFADLHWPPEVRKAAKKLNKYSLFVHNIRCSPYLLPSPRWDNGVIMVWYAFNGMIRPTARNAVPLP